MKKGSSCYTEEHIIFLRQYVAGRSKKELPKLFNERFNLCVSENIINLLCYKYKLRNGRDTRFYKGMKGRATNFKANSGSFKKDTNVILYIQ